MVGITPALASTGTELIFDISDDGRLYQNSHQAGDEFADTFGINDVIGCGYYKESKQVFFTRNGIFVNRLIPYDCSFMYPSIAANQIWTVVVNFGETSFVYLDANKD